MFKINGKKFFIGAALAAAVCFSACSKGGAETADVTETSAETVAAAEETSSAEIESVSAVKPISEPEPPAVNDEDVTEAEGYDTGNPESGLVFFIQPEISQRIDDSRIHYWEPRDTEVKRGYHYDSEWDYLYELIFVFSNYTNEAATVDSIQIIRSSDSEPMRFKDGSDILNISFTVQPMHKTDYLLDYEDFDYYSRESGIYKAVVKVGGEEYEKEFFINNSGEYTETLYTNGKTTTGSAPDFLNEEQRHIFAKAHEMMWKWFWCEGYMPEEYTDTHTAEDFIAELCEAFTENYARELAAKYIDEKGELINIDSGRGGNINYFDHCFLPVSSDDEQVTFKAVVTYCHSDNPYEVWFEEKDYRMVNTENGWRVDKFTVWS